MSPLDMGQTSGLPAAADDLSSEFDSEGNSPVTGVPPKEGLGIGLVIDPMTGARRSAREVSECTVLATPVGITASSCAYTTLVATFNLAVFKYSSPRP